MTQSEVSYKITSELIGRGIVSRGDKDTLEAYINQAYAAGYVYRSKNTRQPKQVMKVSKYGRPIQMYDSVTLAAKDNGVDKTAICKALKGKNRTAAGFKWQYV